MTTAAEILTQHKERICHLFTETKSWPRVFEQLSVELPNPIGMRLPTFKQYAPIMLELMKELNNGLNNTELNNTVKQELEQVKQELNNRLNKKIELNNTVKQELEQVQQQLNTLQELNNRLNNPVKQSVKQGLNIGGWTIHKSGEYHRAFKKVNGKMLAVYLGRTLDDAEQKIHAKEQQLNSGSHTNTSTDT